MIQATARLAALLVLAFAGHASAQQEGGDAAKAVARQREALRRSQQALTQAQEQQAALAREKAQLLTDKTTLAAEVKQKGSQLGGARAESAKLRTELTRQNAALEALQATTAAEQKAATESTGKLALRLDQTQRLLAERTQAVTAVAALAERSTQALSAAERSNREMYAFGLRLIEQLRGRVRDDSVLQSEAVLGFSAVQRENAAEELRDQLDALKLPGAAARN